MKRSFFTGLIFLAIFGADAQEWKPAPAKITTPWTELVNPKNVHNEYPRPQFVRKDWLNLNGLWQYAITAKDASTPANWDGKILVPFAVESSLSGVGKTVTPDQKVWYKTKFSVPAGWGKKEILLHFDAVDWETTVWVNGKKVGEHRGGSDPFVFNIVGFLSGSKDQEIIVSVWDPTDTGDQPRGKQALTPKGIWYTAVTGIWQTVWLEPVEKTHINSLTPVADIDKGTITINKEIANATGNEQLVVKITKNNKPVASKTFAAGTPATLSVPNAELWSPDKPSLYQLDISLLNGKTVLDHASSYFAMRKIAVGKDASGYERLMLNNKPLFQYGTLDQGWWPDGLLTPPTEAAMRFDMDKLKSMGFNMLRKHIKVEPSTYYFYADSIGLLVWQDMVAGFDVSKAVEQHLKAGAKEDWARPKESGVQFEKEWKSIMDHLKFFPSIVTWVTFNEGWGQYDTKRIVEWTKKYDPTRVVDGVTGWADRNVGDMFDSHVYPGPGMESVALHPGKVNVLGEFGGLGYPIEGHLWNPDMRNWGYLTLKSEGELNTGYTNMINALRAMIGRGLAGAVYTQTTDVEGEVNGLMTYDRRVIKVDPEKMKALHSTLYQPQQDWVTLLEDSEVKGQNLLQADADPRLGGPLDLNKMKTSVSPVSVPKGGKSWVAQKFSLKTIPKGLQLRLKATGEIKIWLNNKLIVDKAVVTKRQYSDINLDTFVSALNVGDNVIVAEISNTTKMDNKFDLGLYGTGGK